MGPKLLKGALSLFKPRTGREVAEAAATKGTGNELYYYPKDWQPATRKIITPELREMIESGIVAPSYLNQSSKAQDAARIAGAILERGLPPVRGYMSPWHDSVVIAPSRTGEVADAAAMLDSPLTLRNRDYMYLQDLAANVDAPGAGYSLLRNILKGPLYEDASQVLFTPLPGAKDFYTKKFGMKWLSPKEAESDAVIDAMLGGAGQRHNAEDLGVGIIKRKQGGLASLKGARHG